MFCISAIARSVSWWLVPGRLPGRRFPIAPATRQAAHASATSQPKQPGGNHLDVFKIAAPGPRAHDGALARRRTVLGNLCSALAGAFCFSQR